MKRRFLLPLSLFACVAVGCGERERYSAGNGVGRTPQFQTRDRRPSLLERTAVDSTSGGSTGLSVPQAFGEKPAGDSVAVNSVGDGLFSFGEVDLGATGLAGRPMSGLAMAEGDEQVSALNLRLIEVNSVSREYKELFDRGQGFLSKGDVVQALLCFHEAQQLDNKNFAAYVGEADCYSRQRDYGRALAAIDFAIRAAPSNFALYGKRAVIRYQRRDYDGCIQDFSRVLSADPKDMVTLMNRAHVYAQSGNFKAAAADFTSILNERPDEAGCLLNRGVAYYRMNRWRESLDDAAAVVKLAPNTRDAYFLRALCYAQLGKAEQGRGDFDEAIRLGLEERLAESWRRIFHPPEKS